MSYVGNPGRFSRSAYFALLRLIESEKRIRRQRISRGDLVILNLHRVAPYEGRGVDSLCPRLFQELLVFLKNRCEVLTFADLGHWAPSSRNRVPVILSFDDGYRDFVEYAMPMLDAFNFRANQNIIPECCVTGRPPWTVELRHLISAAPAHRLAQISFPGFPGRLQGCDASSIRQFGNALATYLKGLPRSDREQQCDWVRTHLDEFDVHYGTKMMTMKDISEAATIHEIGAHSFAHDSMGLEDDDFFKRDFTKCKAFFSEQLRLPLDIYAFPNGSFRDEQVELLRSWGIGHTLLVGERPSNRAWNVHPRVTFGAVCRSEVRLRALGWRRGAH